MLPTAAIFTSTQRAAGPCKSGVIVGATARRFVAETIARGVVVNGTLNADRVVRLAPPLTIEDEEIDFAISAMMEALDAMRRGN